MARTERYRLIDVATGAAATFAVADGAVVPAGDAGGGAAELVALVPADRCSLVRVDLPDMSAARMARALRWAVEDSIAGDPEQQHVVPVRRAADGKLLCLVVARADMDQWLGALGQRPLRMLPDAACLPHAAGEVVLMPSGDHVLARTAPDVFDRIEPDLLDSLVPELIDSAGEQARVVWLGDAPPDEIRRFGPETRPDTATALEVLAPEALGRFGAGANLLAGDYAAHDEVSTGRQWRLAGWFAGLALFLLLAGVLVDYTLLKREQLRLEQAVEARFAELFPDISTIVRPRAQAERALAALRGGSRDRFVQLMGAVSPLFSGAAGVQVDSLRYADGVLELELETSSLEDLEALERQLTTQGIAAALRDVEVMTDATRGRIRISEVDS
ncbi:MAG: type II secretion system protein GspL [Wenzhouxiangellaceae bacterium]